MEGRDPQEAEKRAARPHWLRQAILLSGAVAGSVPAATLLPREISAVRGALDLATGAGFTPAAMVADSASVLMGIIAAVAATSSE